MRVLSNDDLLAVAGGDGYITSSQGHVDITVPIMFQGDNLTQSQIDTLISQTESAFNQTVPSSLGENAVAVTLTIQQVTSLSDPHSDVVNVYQTTTPVAPGEPGGHSYTSNGIVTNLALNDQKGLPGLDGATSTKGAASLAHEIGHLLGAPDSTDPTSLMGSGTGTKITATDLVKILMSPHNQTTTPTTTFNGPTPGGPTTDDAQGIGFDGSGALDLAIPDFNYGGYGEIGPSTYIGPDGSTYTLC